MRLRRLHLLAPPLLAGLWAVWLGMQHLHGDMWFVGRVEATMADLRTSMRGTRAPSDRVAIVAIDDAVARDDGGYPISRATIARIVDAIAAGKPKAIGLDMLLVDPGPEEADAALRRALKQNPTVIGTAAVFESSSQVLNGGDGILSDVPHADRFLLPLPRFAEASVIGVVNVATDQVGTPRAVPMVFTDGGRIELSFPLRLAALAEGAAPSVGRDGVRFGNRFVPTDLGHSLPLAFFGPHGTVDTISAAAVLDGSVDPKSFAGKIVIVGVTVTGSGDVFPSTFDPVLPGAEVMATAVSHLVQGDGLLRDNTIRLADFGIAVVLATVVVGLVTWRRSTVSYAAITALLAGWAIANVAAFANGVWFSVALPLTAVGPPAILFGAAQLWLGRRRAQRYATQSKMLQHVHAPGFSEWLARNPDFLTEPIRQDAAILFIDISGFTGLSEKIGPDAVRELLDGFYRLVDKEAVASAGAITSFAGDGAMLIFGLPEPSPHDALNAAQCCVRLIRRMREWLPTLPPEIGTRIGFKMGAHFGPVVASRLGGERNQQITAAGDTVNVANRLMEVAADRGADLAISKKLLEAAGPNSAPAKEGVLSGELESRIRGRARPLSLRVWWDT
jgi:adenylate cyclase